jgi:hypothetical protein
VAKQAGQVGALVVSVLLQVLHKAILRLPTALREAIDRLDNLHVHKSVVRKLFEIAHGLDVSRDVIEVNTHVLNGRIVVLVNQWGAQVVVFDVG